MLEALDPEDRTHFLEVRKGLEAVGIKTQLDHGLVRGLDYYTRTAFEVHDASLGAQSTLGGGGRYDGLVAELGGPPTPGVGFSIGVDRALLVLEQRGRAAPAAGTQVFVAGMGGTQAQVAPLVRALRRRFAVDCDLEGRGVGAQLKQADRSGARLAVLLGEDEWKRDEVVVKDLASGAQESVPRGRLEQVIEERLGSAQEARHG
jgi:histidyl-tRNA synthetase